jgi:MFS transporter, DHA1 family, multidrug resistance protein
VSILPFSSLLYLTALSVFEAFPIIWAKIRGFTPLQSSLVFIGVGIGTTIGAGISWYLSNEYAVQLKRWGGVPPPELRLKGALLAGPFFVGGIFFLGWTGAFHAVPWWVPALATVMVGMSFTLIFISFLVRFFALRYVIVANNILNVDLPRGCIPVSLLFLFVHGCELTTNTPSMYAASALAANTIIRSGIAAAFPLFTSQMFDGVSVFLN